MAGFGGAEPDPQPVRSLKGRGGLRPIHQGRERAQPQPSGTCRALHLVKVTGATLAIAAPDWLSRNTVFLLTLHDSGVRFLAVDLPGGNDLTVGNIALPAQAAGEALSRRTK